MPLAPIRPAEVGEPEAALRVENQVVGRRQLVVANLGVEALALAGVQIDAVDAAIGLDRKSVV